MSKKKRNYLKTVRDTVQMCNHPLNHSKSKELYSFSKAERFEDPSKRYTCKTAFYDINSAFYNRSRAFSLKTGHRMNFLKCDKDIPAPNKYMVRNYSVNNNSKNKGFSFGSSREKAKTLAALVQKEQCKVPGPGSYHLKRNLPEKNFSFRLRTKAPDANKINVGPGQYNIPSIFGKKNQNYLSNVENIRNVKLVPPNQNKRRMAKQRSLHKFYDIKEQINQSGNYYNSKYKNIFCKTFGKQKRAFHRVPSAKPGPGAYLLPGDFGMYQSSTVVNEKG